MRFSFDLDGTVTRYPEIFQALGRSLKSDGHEVFILTGVSLGTFRGKRSSKYRFLEDHSWYDEVITSSNYNNEEMALAAKVIDGVLDNHVLVRIFKRRVCGELNISCHFDDDVAHVRSKGAVPVFGVAKQ